MGQYMMANNLTVLYCQDLRLKLSCKELMTNKEGILFEKYGGNLNLLEYYTEFSQEEVELFITSIVKPKIGIELSKKEMDWIKEFESIDYEEIRDNDALVFNYCILKLKLLGMPEDMAIKIISTEFINKKTIPDYPPIENMIDKINSMLKSRAYWIPNNLNLFEEKEIEFFDKVFEYKSQLGYKFEFNIFKNDYLALMERSFIPYLIEYNSKESYLVNNPIDFMKQREYLATSYEFLITGVLYEVLKKYTIRHSATFIKDLMKDLNSTLNFYFNVLSQKLN